MGYPRCVPSASGLSSVELPPTWDALQFVLASVDETQPGAGDEIGDGARGEHLSRVGEVADAGAEMHGDPAEIVASALALTGVYAGADLDAQGPHRLRCCHGVPHRPCGAVEGGEEPVPGCLHLTAAE